MAMTTTEVANGVDPVTFEVIRHRLLGITDEQAARLSAISGSKNVTEMSDFNVGIYLPDGSVATMGRTILFHAYSMAAMVHHVMEDCAENPGIGPGDMFVVNNPWKGAVHGPDMAIVAPIFHEGRHIFWSGGIMHMADIGGIAAGGMGMAATDTYQEGLLLPPIKLVEGGVLREDLWNMILSHSRASQAMSLDLKGLMAANYAASDQLIKLVERYGVDTLLGVMEGLVTLSEERMRRRLRELPDVTIETTGYLEYNRATKEHPQVTLELTKIDDRLIFDFSRSSEQVPDASNCTFAGLMAGVSAALLPTIAYDIPWNGGLYRPIEVICPEGKICNAKKPAAVAGNISGSVWEVQVTGIDALSKLVACSDTYLEEAEAAAAGRPGSSGSFNGVNQRGEVFHGGTMETLASGGGAYFDHDGVDVQGHHDIERVRISNVEALELDMPMLYLWRGFMTDGAGAGEFRGGLSIGTLRTGHKSDQSFVGVPRVVAMPDSFGIFGGYPALLGEANLQPNSNVEEFYARGVVPVIGQAHGDELPLDKMGTSQPFRDDDLLFTNNPAAAGWGDPLDRSLDALALDIETAAVSRKAAEHFYGAIFRGDAIDHQATEAHRAEIRKARTAWPVRERCEYVGDHRTDTRIGPIGDRLEVISSAEGTFTRCRCGFVLGPAKRNWRDYSATVVVDPTDIGVGFSVPEGFEIREFACPGCGTLHAAEIYRIGDPDRHDVRLVLER